MPQPRSNSGRPGRRSTRSGAAPSRRTSGSAARTSSRKPASGRGSATAKRSTGSSRRSAASKSTAAKSASTARKTTARKTTVRKATATKKTAPKKTARKSTAAKSASSARKTTARKTTARKAITRKPAGRRAASGRSTSSRRPTAARTDESAAALSALREHLTRGVMLTGERLQETLNDTVRRGRITRDDADDLLASLISIGRKQTEDVLADLEQLIGSGPSDAAAAARVAGKRARARVEVTAARARHSEPADRVLREVDRARRAAGLGPSFPVMGYDELSAAQISSRLTSLTSAQVRKVRDYERRHANRKSVLNEIEKRLK